MGSSEIIGKNRKNRSAGQPVSVVKTHGHPTTIRLF